MIIRSLRLVNFKSYSEATIQFELGTNAIVGENGAGKSTILEAIGLALFDHVEAVRQSNLVREGQTSGLVAVTFHSALDDRLYTVERQLGRSGTTRYRVLDDALDNRLLAESVSEVTQWLRLHLGLESSARLDDLFRNTIGVPQGSTTAPFLLTAADRKRIFDPLLRVDEYQRSWENLRETGRHLSDQRQQLDEEIARLEGTLAQLPSLQAEQTSLTQAITEHTTALETLSSTQSEILGRLGAYDELATRLQMLDQQRAQAATRLEATSRALTGAERAVAEAVEAAERQAQAEAGYRNYLVAEQERTRLEGERSLRDALTLDLERLHAAEGRVQANLRNVERALEQIAAAKLEHTTLEPLVAQQRELESSIAAARTEERILQEAQRQADLLSTELAAQQRRLAELELSLAKVPALERSLAEVNEALERIQDEVRTRTDERSAAEAMLARLKEQSQALEREHGATCPVCEGELSPAHRTALLSRNSAQVRTVAESVNGLATELRLLATKQDAARKERTALEQRLRQQPLASQRDEVAAELEARVARHAALLADVQRAATQSAELPRLRQALDALGDPVTRTNILQSRMAEEDAHSKEREQLLQQAVQLADEIAATESRLEAYQHLDDAWQQILTALTAARQDHDTYLSAQDLAAQRSSREAELDQVQRQMTALRETSAALQAERNQLALEYDAEAHAALRQQDARIRAELVRRAALRDAALLRQSTVAEQIEALMMNASALDQKREQRTNTERVSRTLEEIRQLLREAGPYVTRHLVAAVSDQADSFYRDIMNDYSGHLSWSESYELTLEIKGHMRSFQQLSGGEQMSAALALRLALLRQLSNVSVAFFDEPTAHLDPERRDSLATQIMQVRGFDQLFVISHDDTFERAADNYIRVTKVDGTSRVEA
ncbi:MAG: AAA family ATPase [Anaerolineae bacterium]|jgi:exonuclease SbcC|nr:SMC family ATPase [Chloroflexota bacterium]